MSLVPHHSGQPVTFEKVDLGVHFSLQNPTMDRLARRVQEAHWPPVVLSQSDSGSLWRSPQLLAVEIKPPAGSYDSSSLQLAIWLAAGLEKIEQLRRLASERIPLEELNVDPTLPLIGITDLGHIWSLHLMAKRDNGDMVRNAIPGSCGLVNQLANAKPIHIGLAWPIQFW